MLSCRGTLTVSFFNMPYTETLSIRGVVLSVAQGESFPSAAEKCCPNAPIDRFLVDRMCGLGKLQVVAQNDEKCDANGRTGLLLKNIPSDQIGSSGSESRPSADRRASSAAEPVDTVHKQTEPAELASCEI
jgi:hypothetical protein